MSYLSKNQYDRRAESAARRNSENEEIAVENGMTEEQAELISSLCSLRHEFHSNMDGIAQSDEGDLKEKLVSVNSEIRESGFPPMRFIPSQDDDYIDIDTIQELKDIDDDVPDSDSMEYDDWYSSEYARIMGELETLNGDIENYLGKIDEAYGTHFKPTGNLRNF